MRVLVACEYSGRVRDAFIAEGHDAMSCDLLPTESPGPHYQGDVLDILTLESWDLMIAFPPCTHLACIGAVWWKYKEKEQADALAFVQALMDAPIPHIAIENPVGKINTAIRKPDQIIQPYWFGDPWSKKTCLWLRNLPLLVPTNHIEPIGAWVTSGSTYRKEIKPLPGQHDPHVRSLTFQGIADAMAEQWGAL